MHTSATAWPQECFCLERRLYEESKNRKIRAVKIISNNFGGFIPPETFCYSDLCHDIYFVLTSVENAYSHMFLILSLVLDILLLWNFKFLHTIFSEILVTEYSINYHLILIFYFIIEFQFKEKSEKCINNSIFHWNFTFTRLKLLQKLTCLTCQYYSEISVTPVTFCRYFHQKYT